MLLSNASLIYGIANFTINTTAISYKVDRYTYATDNLTVKIGSTTIATRSNVTGDSTGTITKTITFSSAELTKIYNAMPKAVNATFTFVLTTVYSDGSSESTTTTAVGTLPTTIKPKVTSISLVEATSGLAAKFGAFVKDKSKLTYTFATTLATGTTLSTYNFTINGTTYSKNTGTTNALNASGTLTYTAYVIDSRGRKSDTLTGTISVLDYASPQISTFKVIRCNAQGVENNEGAYAKYTVNASISSVNSKNNKSIVIAYKKQKDTTWTNWKNYTAGYTLNETSAVLAISTDDAYHFRVVVTDYFTNSSKIQSVSSAFTLMDILADGTGLAFGKVATDSNTLDIGFTTTNLSRVSYVGGKSDSSEKNMYFPSPSDSTYPHNSKVYGGNGTSPVALGMWDTNKSSPIFQYFDGSDYRLKFGDEIKLRHGEYDIESVIKKSAANTTGSIHLKSGLLIQWGSETITPAANTPTSVTITFSTSYDYTPYIGVSALSTVVGTSVLGYGHSSDSKTGTILWVTRTNTTDTVIRWLAVGFKAI